ncbi:MAG: hypothetical protein AAGA50_02115 [Pseudomonadota bacterium]
MSSLLCPEVRGWHVFEVAAISGKYDTNSFAGRRQKRKLTLALFCSGKNGTCRRQPGDTPNAPSTHLFSVGNDNHSGCISQNDMKFARNGFLNGKIALNLKYVIEITF